MRTRHMNGGRYIVDIKMVLLDKACVPFKAHDNDAGMDVKARIQSLISISQFATVKIPIGICVEIPPGHMGILLPRSSMASSGIVVESPSIDAGYTGEIQAIVTNNSSVPYHINPYDRIAQLVVVPIAQIDKIVFVNELQETDRGGDGFGSTGR